MFKFIKTKQIKNKCLKLCELNIATFNYRPTGRPNVQATLNSNCPHSPPCIF